MSDDNPLPEETVNEVVSEEHEAPQASARPGVRILTVTGTIIGLVVGVLSIVQQLSGVFAIEVHPAFLLFGAVVILTVVVYAERESIAVRRTTRIVDTVARNLRAWNHVVLLVCVILAVGFTVHISLVGSQLAHTAKLAGTRYHGSFPRNMSAITELISASRTKLVIAVDYAEYGRFSNPRGYADYRAALDRLMIDKKNVTILLYNHEAGKNAILEQFSMHSEDPDKPNPKFEEFQSRDPRFLAYYENVPSTLRPKTPIEWADDMLKSDDTQAEVWERQGAVVNRTPRGKQRLPIFMWIRDDEEAIFSLINMGEDSREESFHTTDKNLIVTFIRMIENDYQQSSENGFDGGDNEKTPRDGDPEAETTALKAALNSVTERRSGRGVCTVRGMS